MTGRRRAVGAVDWRRTTGRHRTTGRRGDTCCRDVGPGRGPRVGAAPRAFDRLDDDDEARGLPAREDAGAPQPDPAPGSELDGVAGPVAMRHHERGVVPDRALFLTGEQALGRRVEHARRLAEGEHRLPGGPGVRPDVRLEQRLLGPAAVEQQVAADVLGRRPGECVHQRGPGVGQGGQIEDPLDPPGERVDDRGPGAGERLQLLGVVLGADDRHRPARLDHRADAVGADRTLGVRVPRDEVDPVQQPAQPA
ncbi:hypothetical protein SDC9_112454 [bioreactor metagenome]|uniref:Uncharacterized protein n=1 Tax=bioreactor metagenome TaxID=1076179 RepID=A0A645BJN4_9ZZZZ